MISVDGQLTLADRSVLPANTWYSLRQLNYPLKEIESGSLLLFTNGDILAATAVSSDGTTVQVHPTIASNDEFLISIPLNSVRAYLARPCNDVEWAERSNQVRSRDLLILRKGDVINGSIAAINEQGFQIQEGSKTTTVGHSQLQALWLNTELARVRKPKGNYYRVFLKDGSRLAVSNVSSDEQNITLTFFGKESLRLPKSSLVSLDVEQANSVSLQELTPRQVQYQSFDGETRTPQVNRNLLNHPLRIQELSGESLYSQGLGLSAGMTISYDLAGKYKQLSATVAMDSRDGRRGGAVVKILKDGQAVELPERGKIGLTPVDYFIDLAGAKTLTITVLRDGPVGVQEMVNLVNVRLIP